MTPKLPQGLRARRRPMPRPRRARWDPCSLAAPWQLPGSAPSPCSWVPNVGSGGVLSSAGCLLSQERSPGRGSGQHRAEPSQPHAAPQTPPTGPSPSSLCTLVTKSMWHPRPHSPGPWRAQWGQSSAPRVWAWGLCTPCSLPPVGHPVVQPGNLQATSDCHSPGNLSPRMSLRPSPSGHSPHST